MRYIPGANNRKYQRVYRGGNIGFVIRSLGSLAMPLLKTGARTLLGIASNKLKDKQFQKYVLESAGSMAGRFVADKGLEVLQNLNEKLSNKITPEVKGSSIDKLVSQNLLVKPNEVQNPPTNLGKHGNIIDHSALASLLGPNRRVKRGGMVRY